MTALRNFWMTDDAYFRRAFLKAYPYLFLDATFLDACWAGAVEMAHREDRPEKLHQS